MNNTIYEKKLVEELSRGSYKAFTQLYNLYSSHLFGFVLNTLKSRSQTSDIVQDTFLRIWENRTKINPELSFKSFIFTIAHHLLISEYRRQINRPELMEYIEFANSVELSDQTALQRMDLDEFIVQLEKAKKKLPPRQKEIFELIKEDGLSSTEVAEQLGITEQVVRNQLSITLKTLRKLLGNTFVFFIFFLS